MVKRGTQFSFILNFRFLTHFLKIMNIGGVRGEEGGKVDGVPDLISGLMGIQVSFTSNSRLLIKY